jgi:hypothetical protein
VRRECALCPNRPLYRFVRRPERNKEAVAARLDLCATRFRKGCAKQTPMLRQQRLVGRTEPTKQAGRALNVGEKKRDGTAR